jgi:hypothetical protein
MAAQQHGIGAANFTAYLIGLSGKSLKPFDRDGIKCTNFKHDFFRCIARDEGFWGGNGWEYPRAERRLTEIMGIYWI